MVDTNALKAEIVRNGYTVKSLALVLGMSANSLYDKVNGKSALNSCEIIKLCEILNIDDPAVKVSIFLPDNSQ